MQKEVVVTANKVRKRKKLGRIVRISLLVLLLFLIVIYIILQVIYGNGRFTVSLDSNETLESGIAIYEHLDDPIGKRKLFADELPFMDNISYKWLPEDLTKYEGSHNGDNYIAYSFYIENQGSEILNYWYEVEIKDVIKNVDEAIRILIIKNDEEKVYAKVNPLNKEAEVGTIPFKDDKIIILEQRQKFNPGDIDKFTIVMWLEGDDPECVDSLIGGELKVLMNIREEHIGLNKKVGGK